MQFYVKIVVWNVILKRLWLLWFVRFFFFFLVFFFVVVVPVVVFCLCSKKQGYDHLLFLMSFREKKFQMKTFGVHWLIIWYPEETCFHVHGSYGTVFFINRYMYFCVVAFINDTITLSFSCSPLNFSFLQIYIKTRVTLGGFWVLLWSSLTGKCEFFRYANWCETLRNAKEYNQECTVFAL